MTTHQGDGTAVASSHDLISAHEAHLFPWVKPYYREPIVLLEGEGVWVRDVEGREFLDFFAGILTTSIGHCHPAVIERVDRQMRKLGHTSTLYVTENHGGMARKLSELAPGQLRRAAFTNSGTEAVETAIIAASLYTRRSEIIALRYSYSGRSILASNLTAHASWRPLSTQIAGIKHARAPYVYRSPLGPDVPEHVHTDFFIDDLVETIETTTGGKPAALIAESILGVGGFIVPPAGYLNRAAEVIRDYGGVFISDEVQAGFGRTGDKWFGCEHWGVEPDIMIMAKGIANGFPVGATLARDEIADAWTNLSISTYGGNPISMAAAAATLDVMVEEDVPARAAERGNQVRSALELLFEEYSWIGEVRGMGLMQALELVKDRKSKEPAPDRAKAVQQAAREEGLLIGLGGLKGHVIWLGPSLLITEEETEEAMNRLARAFARADRAV